MDVEVVKANNSLANYGTVCELRQKDIYEESSDDEVMNKDYISIWKAIEEIILKAIPSVVLFVAINGIIVLDNFFIGIKGDSVALTGWGLGAVTISIIILAVDFGIADGMDVVVSRAYGRRDFRAWIIHLNQWRFSLLILAIPQFFVMLFLESIYEIFGQPTQIAHTAWLFWMITFPGCILMNLFECNRRYLVWCEIYNAGTIINIITFSMHIILLSISVLYFEFGIYGAGVSTTITYTFDFIILEIYRKFQTKEVLKSSWMFPTSEILEWINEFLKFAIPGWFTMILSWWPIEIITIFAGMMGAAQLTASTMLSNIYLLCCDIALGVGYASVAVIGNSLGENLPNKAKTYKNATLAISSTLSIVLIISIILSKNFLVSSYTETEEEANQVQNVFVFFLIDLAFGILFEVVYEMLEVWGYQLLLLCSVILFSWIITLPACYLVGITFLYGFVGQRITLVCCNLALSIANFLLILKVDWEKVALEASHNL